MKSEKVRNLTADELVHQERELSEQLFKLKFQLNMGQTESLKKIRGLRKDIARVKTIARERELTAAQRNGEKVAWLKPGHNPRNRKSNRRRPDGARSWWARWSPAA